MVEAVLTLIFILVLAFSGHRRPVQLVWGLGRSGEIGLVDIVVQMFCRNPGDAVTLVALRLVAAPVRPSAMGTRLSPATKLTVSG